MTLDEQKQAAARASLRFVEQGDVVGLGTGSTATHFVRFLGARVREGLKIRGIPSSLETQRLAQELGIPLTNFDECQQIDVAIDGVDEFDPQLHLIKGGGGAMLREKIVASAAKKFVIVADSTKQVPVLGKFPVPVEVIPFAQTLVAREIAALGALVKMRLDKDGNKCVTDEKNHILDCTFGKIPAPAALSAQLKSIPGIVEHGLFVNLADVVLLATDAGVREIRNPK
jgi:ribose 5-phosphate isomerase A